MKTKNITNASQFGWMAVAVVMVILYASYFFFFMPQQQLTLKKRGFRILEEYGNNLDGKQTYFNKHIKNYGPYYVLKSFLAQNSLEEETFITHFNDAYEVIHMLDPSVHAEQADASHSNNDLEPFLSADSMFIEYIIRPKIDLSCKQNKDDGRSNECEELVSKINSFIQNKFVVRVPLSSLMEGLKFDKLLDNVFIFRQTGVLHNSNHDFVQDITNTEAIFDSVQDHQGGVIEKITVRGEEKHFLIIPLDWLEGEYFLAGTIADEVFRQRTRVSGQVLAIVSGILLLVLIGLPVMKIIFINRQERLQISDAYAANLSIVLGSALLVLVTIALLKNELVDSSTERKRVIELSDLLFSNLEKDLDWIFDLKADIFDPEEKDSGALYYQARNVLKEKEHTYGHVPEELAAQEPPFNEIFTIKSDGEMRNALTRTPFSDATTIDLSERNYFRNALWKDRSWTGGDHESGFFLESIKSYNTTNKEAAVSFHLEGKERDSMNAPVMAVTSKLPSLYNQVLPPDVKYLVINEAGLVLFHSAEEKNLHENFLEECGDNPEILGAIRLRIDKEMRVTYNEEHWMARIKPIRDMPLYHITLLNQEVPHRRNTRIMLFTFYFFILTMVWIGLSLLVLRRPRSKEKIGMSRTWSLNWLVYRPENYGRYLVFLLLLVVFSVLETVGIVVVSHPVQLFVYQLIFVTASGVAALYLLGRRDPASGSKSLTFYEGFVSAVLVSLLVLFAILVDGKRVLLVPLVALVVMALVIVFPWPDKVLKNDECPARGRRIYHAMMFFWLICLAVVPVLGYYHAIRQKEDLIDRRVLMEDIARQNIFLAMKYSDAGDQPWYRRIQGNGLDGLKVRTVEDLEIDTADRTPPYQDQLYGLLPEPFSGKQDLMTYLSEKGHNNEWEWKDSGLQYTLAGKSGGVVIENADEKEKVTAGWVVSLLLVFLVFVLVSRFVFRYIIEHVFDTRCVITPLKDEDKWKEVLTGQTPRRILLNTFNGLHYRRKSEGILNPPVTSGWIFIPINAAGLLDGSQPMQGDLLNTNVVFWVYDLEHYLHKLKDHENILDRLSFLKTHAKGKVIVAMPFEFDHITEFYSDYLAESTGKEDDRVPVETLRTRWESLFQDFDQFVGNPLFEKGTEKNESDPLFGEAGYRYILSFLTRGEKLLLFDTVEDGLLNLKNRTLISRLINKKLIVPDPEPRVFDEGFGNFIRESVSEEGARALEKKLGMKGNWRSIRYIILLILLPMVIFVFLSQGFSFQKVVAILGGVLAVLGGVVKMFDSNLFRQG